MDKCLLGISSGFHDSAAAIVDYNGNLLFASSEERLTRIKGDRSFPNNSIDSCIDFCRDSNLKIDRLCLHENPYNKIFFSANNSDLIKSLGHIFSQCSNIVNFERNIKHLCSKLLVADESIFVSNHHLSHAYTAVSSSGTSDGLVVVLDAIGESSSGLIGKYEAGKIVEYQLLPLRNSLGLIYSAITVYCGFKVLTGEYKLMGLAPYGVPRYLQQLKNIFGDPKRISPHISDLSIFSDTLISKKLKDLLGFPPRKGEQEPVRKCHADLAASIQKYLEESVVELVHSSLEKFSPSASNLVLGGGIALNCKLNMVIAKSFQRQFSKIWAFPASGDAGSAYGACINNLVFLGKQPCNKFLCAFLGKSYEIKKFLDRSNFTYCAYDCDQEEKIVELISNGKVGAIFQNRAEFGPRALGHRSIIASAKNFESLDFINRNVKQREDFRPLAPVMLRSLAENYFEIFPSCFDMYRFMLCLSNSVLDQSKIPLLSDASIDDVVKPLSSMHNDIPAAVHLDGTARVQLIEDESQCLIADLLKKMHAKFGEVALINTSLNVRGEPIVETPEDALKCFVNANLNFIVMEDFVVYRDDQSPILLAKDHIAFELD